MSAFMSHCRCLNEVKHHLLLTLLVLFIVLPACFVRYATAGTTLASAVSYLISKDTYTFLKPRK